MHWLTKSRLWAIARIAIPVAIIYFLFRNIPQEKWDLLSAQPIEYRYAVAALLVALVGVSISFTRWRMLVRCLEIDLSLLEAFRLGSIGFLMNFVSVGSVGGDLFKAVFLARRRPGKRVAAVASVFVDRACGLYGLVLLVSVTLLLTGPLGSQDESGEMQRIRIATAALAGTGTAALMVLILGGRSVDRLVTWGSKLRIVGPLIHAIGPPLRMFHRHPITFGISVLMSMGVHTTLTLSVYLIAMGFYRNPPTLAEHFVMVPAAMLVSALPITPAGLGVFEGAMDWLYNVVPATPTLASGTIVALGFELVRVTIAIIGTIFYWTADEEVRASLDGESAEAGPSSARGSAA